MKGLQEHYRSMKIKTKIILIYITVLVLSITISFSIISSINRMYIKKEVGEAGRQTLNALKGNLGMILNNVTQFSDLIYFDEQIQSSLKGIDSDYLDPIILNNIKRSLVNMILSGDYLSGVYIFDKYQNHYSSYKMAPESIHADRLDHARWYRTLQEEETNGFFIHRSEGVIQYRYNRNYISFVRPIGDANTYEPLATLLVTIDAKTIEDYFQEVSGGHGNNFFIVDGQGRYIVPPKEHLEPLAKFMGTQGLTQGEATSASIEDTQMILISQDMGIGDWILVGAFTVDNFGALAPYYTSTILLIVAMNILFIFISSVFLTRLIFTPLSKVAQHMELVEKGHFVTLPVEPYHNEVSTLKSVFNHMTLAIQNLIAKVKEEEQVIAKGKLDMINAQINPHFLYNTLDAVSALALMEDHQSVFKMTQALGSFYRNSLNSGLDFISIRDELESIRSYITILNIRYDNKIQVTYQVEEGLLEEKILKLLLQPPVENAVHHGIKGNEGAGRIHIRVYRQGEEIHFSIKDDGKGMTEERRLEVLAGTHVTGKSGFGIKSQMERIRLYYGIEEAITLKSTWGEGTEIIIRVHPLEGEKNHGHKGPHRGR